MGMSPQLITKSLYERAVAQLQTLKEDNRAAIRLRAIVSAKDHGVHVVAKVFDISANTLRTWVRSYEKKALPVFITSLGGVERATYKNLITKQ